MIHGMGRLAYRFLLRLLPAEFRLKHGAEMEELFLEAISVHRRRGIPVWILGWFRGSADVVELAIRLRAARMDGETPIPSPSIFNVTKLVLIPAASNIKRVLSSRIVIEGTPSARPWNQPGRKTSRSIVDAQLRHVGPRNFRVWRCRMVIWAQ